MFKKAQPQLFLAFLLSSLVDGRPRFCLVALVDSVCYRGLSQRRCDIDERRGRFKERKNDIENPRLTYLTFRCPPNIQNRYSKIHLQLLCWIVYQDKQSFLNLFLARKYFSSDRIPRYSGCTKPHILRDKAT